MERLKATVHKALRRSEAFFKTDMVYLAKGGFWLTLGQVMAAGGSFVLAIAFAHLFPKDAYGTYKYVVSLAAIIGTLTLTGLPVAVTQSVSRGFEGALKEGYRATFRWGMGMVLISLAASGYYLFHHNYLLAYALLIVGITAPMLDAAGLFSSFLGGKKEFKTISILNTLQNLLPPLLLIVALLTLPKTGVIITVYFLALTLATYFGYWYTLRRYRPRDATDPEMIGYAKHLSGISILNAVADQIDSIIVYHYVGAIDLAVYTFATAIPVQIKGVFKGIYSLAFPKFAGRDLDDLKRTMRAKMLRMLLIIIPIVVLYILAAPYIYRIFFPAYLNAVGMSRVFALSLLPYISIIPATALQAKKAVRSLYGSTISFAVVKIVMLFSGVALLGLWGVVYARVAYEYIGLCIYWFYTVRTRDTSPIV